MKTRQALSVILLGISGLLLQGVAAKADDQTETERQSCLRSTFFNGGEYRLTKEEQGLAEGLAERAELLASGVLQVEEILERADYKPSEFPNKGYAWAAVLSGEAYQVGVYQAGENRLERLDLLRDGERERLKLSERFTLAEQALANTPSDCSRSFGVLDQGLETANGGRALYAIQLVDRSLELAWGMHYRFEVLDGKLQRLDRLHVRCSVMSVVPRMAIDDSARSERAPLLIESLPGMDLPTEAQLMQLHLYPDLPGSPDFKFWAKERVFDFPHGQTVFPERYERKMNPCSLAES